MTENIVKYGVCEKIRAQGIPCKKLHPRVQHINQIVYFIGHRGNGKRQDFSLRDFYTYVCTCVVNILRAPNAYAPRTWPTYLKT